jgi:hypothetical protein
MSTEALREASRHQFLGRRNELSARLEMDCRKGQNGFGGRLRHETGCDPSGSNLYRISNRLGSVNHGGRSRAVLQRFPTTHVAFGRKWTSRVGRLMSVDRCRSGIGIARLSRRLLTRRGIRRRPTHLPYDGAGSIAQEREARLLAAHPVDVWPPSARVDSRE